VLALPLAPMALAIPLDPSAYASIGSAVGTSGSLALGSSTLFASGSFRTSGLSFGGLVIGAGVLQSQPGGPDIAVFTFDNIDLGAGVNITITGSRPVAILSKRDAISRSTVAVSAGSLGGGAGGAEGAPLVGGSIGPGAGTGGGQSGGGGGGGGFGGAGGHGAGVIGVDLAAIGITGDGGLAYGDALATLQGGSGGGGGIRLSGGADGRGGGGGGALQIGAAGLTQVVSVAVVGGATGGNGGAGSGGMIELRGARGGFGAGAVLDASGGAVVIPAVPGSGFGLPQISGGGGGGGRILVAPVEYAWGVDASPTFDVSGGEVSVSATAGTTLAQAGAAGVARVHADVLSVGAGKALVLGGGPLRVPGSAVALEFSEIRIDAGGLAFATAPFALTKTLRMHGGFVTAPAGLTVAPGTMLTGFGTVGGPLYLPGSRFLIADGGALSVGDLASPNGVRIEGIVNVRDDSTLLIQNAGRAMLGSSTVLFNGSRFVSVNGLEQASGAILSASGSATIHGAFRNQGMVIGAPVRGEAITFLGDVDGAGRFFDGVVFRAGFSPGNSPAVVHLDNVKFDPTATLSIEISGLAPGQFDQLVVAGAAELDGTRQLTFIDGFATRGGDSFAFLVAGSRTGTFSRVKVTGLDPALRHAVAYDADGARFDVQAVPEPGTWAMLLAGLGALVIVSRHRRAPATVAGRRG